VYLTLGRFEHDQLLSFAATSIHELEQHLRALHLTLSGQQRGSTHENTVQPKLLQGILLRGWLPLHEILEQQKHSFARYFPADPNFQRERSYSSRKSVMFAGFGFGCFLSEA
jgi:hypothetical protein